MAQHERQRKWYEKNKEAIKKKNSERRREYRDRNRQFVRNYLMTHPCEVCGEDDPIVLDFHHTNDNKESTISKMSAKPCSIKKIQQEIDKCVVLCANDHRRRHAELRA